ncbi:hypothetical protein EON83_00125 [bacterium]|nr:MAG: hypothetical protein EON83_00125 [bacterium]
MKHIIPRRFKAPLCAALALCALLGTSHAVDADRQSELKRHSDNTQRLAKMAPWARPKVAAVISDLEGHGYRPLIDGQVYRTPSQQAALKAAGRSSVSYSFHTVTDLDSKGKRTLPASFAADIVDKRYGWNSKTPYWLTLARSAEAHQMATGIRWGLPSADRQKISGAIQARNFLASVRLGWDPAHVEPSGSILTLSQAKAGKRPR